MAQILDLSARYKLRFTGPQALWFLDQLVTNQIVDLPAGSGKPALLLTPKGRITAAQRILSTDEGALADIDAADPGSILDFFSMRVFTTKVTIDDVTNEFALVRVVGEDAGKAVAELGDPSPERHGVVRFDSGYLVTLDAPLEGVDVWIRRDAKERVLDAVSGAEAISAAEYDAYRVSRGMPVFGVDFDSTYLPQEAALERAVHFNKGCYLGQEAVAMAQRGKVKRRVRHLRFERTPALGELWQGDSNVGRVTSAADGDDGGFGIATVKTTVEPGSLVELRIADAEASSARVAVLPGTVEGPSVPSARELRERLQRGG